MSGFVGMPTFYSPSWTRRGSALNKTLACLKLVQGMQGGMTFYQLRRLLRRLLNLVFTPPRQTFSKRGCILSWTAACMQWGRRNCTAFYGILLLKITLKDFSQSAALKRCILGSAKSYSSLSQWLFSPLLLCRKMSL